MLTIDNGTCQATSAQIITIVSQVNVNEVISPVSQVSVFPYPSNGDLRISFKLSARTNIQAGITDMFGRFIKLIATGPADEGSHEYHILKGELAPGIYFLRLASDQSVESLRFVILK